VKKYKRIWVSENFSKMIKVEAAKKGISILKLTENFDLQLDKDKFNRKKKRSVFSEQWVDL
jgi:hypothetical protein